MLNKEKPQARRIGKENRSNKRTKTQDWNETIDIAEVAFPSSNTASERKGGIKPICKTEACRKGRRGAALRGALWVSPVKKVRRIKDALR